MESVLCVLKKLTIMDKDKSYLTDMPDTLNEYGISKVLLTRKETINIKHIQTEIFVRGNIDIQKYLDVLEWDLFRYMEHLTQRLRKIYKINRWVNHDPNEIVKESGKNFFHFLKMYQETKSAIVLDFDGVITKNSFRNLYLRIIDLPFKKVVCSANPTITQSWFEIRNLPLPNKIYSMKGKNKKIKMLSEIAKSHDFIFYIDNETEYLDFGWLLGMRCFHYRNNKIIKYSLQEK